MFSNTRHSHRNNTKLLSLLVFAILLGLWAVNSRLWADKQSKQNLAQCSIPGSASKNPNVFPVAVQKLFALPDDQIDIGTAALTLDKQARPDIDVAAYSKRIDDLAAKVKRLNESRGGHSYLWSMGSVLQQEGFVFDFSTDYRQHQFNHTLSGVLDTKRGFCDSLTALYIAIAQRVGLRPHPVLAPGHIFVRYTGLPGGDMNIDPTSGGTLPDSAYIQKFHIADKSIQSGAYLRTLSYNEYLGVLMLQTAQDMRFFGSTGMIKKSKAYYDKAAELNPRDAEIAEGLRRVYSVQSMNAASDRNESLAREYHAKEEDYARKADELGYVKGFDE
jgi:regulator of sirC expression with transglutaminase-like and TPR domain